MKTRIDDGAMTIDKLVTALNNANITLDTQLKELEGKFDNAKREWKDKNADAVTEFLNSHRKILNSNLEYLRRLANSAEILKEIIREYEC